jgi:carboxypeptidase C (cathepsin A)
MTGKRASLWVAVVLVFFGAAGADAQPPAAERPRVGVDAVAPATEPGKPVPDEQFSQTSHAVRIGGVEVKYTATAGTLLLKDAAGKPKANVFFVAYTADTTDPAARPITFAYNGGPGSASIWLHMGALGPKRVQMAEEGFQPGPPFRLVDNDASLIDVSDVVLIDAISTGYSRPVAGEDPKQFHGVREDLEWFTEFIRRYLTRFDRWRSPKFLLGESYGTFRSAGLAATLQQRGIELNGIVLVSSVLDFATIRTAENNDRPYVTFLPTYTATAWYHKKLPPDLQQKSLKDALEAARAFALGEYATALLKGNRLTEAERKAVAQQVARYTGLSPSYVELANLRVEPGRFRKELLRDRRLVTGRLDSRFTAMDADAAGERQEFDPSNTAIAGPYTALFVDYVQRELGYKTDLVYYTSGPVQPWNYGDYQNRYASHVESLRGAMARNPYLKVFVAAGYYDMATPFFGAEYDFMHLGWEPAYQQRVSWGYYEAGHMMYIRPDALRQLKRDLAAFIRSAAGPHRETNDRP